MRIAFVSQEYPPETAKGGIGAQAILKARGLAARGHDVHVISRSANHQRTERTDDRIHVIRIPGFEIKMPVYTEIADWLTYSAEVSVAINALHKQAPLDLVEFPEWACEGYVHLINRTQWNYIPTVIHLHGPLVMFAHVLGWPDIQSDFFRVGTEMERTCLQSADAIYSSSQCSADWCARHYGLDMKTIPILHTGVDTSLFSPRSFPPEKTPTIIFVGKLVRNKGVFELAEAAIQLNREFPGLKLKFIGRGEENIVKELQARTKAASCPKLIDFLGYVPREMIPEHLSRAHVFAAPSKYEGGPGFVYLEAMACGLPVVACAGSGASEVIEADVNGLLVPPDHPDALCDALRKLLTRNGERERMGLSARNYVLQHADSVACMDKIEAYYHSVISRKSSGASS